MEAVATYAVETPARDLPRYISHKSVRALKISAIDEPAGDGQALHFEDARFSPRIVPLGWVKSRKAQAGGYFVVYEGSTDENGDYTSWSPAQAFEQGYTRAEHWGIPRSQEPKYTVAGGGRIANRSTGRLIPDEEPLFIVRGQDKLAIQTLQAYRQMVAAVGGNAGSIDERLLAFSGYANSYSERMKYPDPDNVVDAEVATTSK